jgi:hypothetical protein
MKFPLENAETEAEQRVFRYTVVLLLCIIGLILVERMCLPADPLSLCSEQSHAGAKPF